MQTAQYGGSVRGTFVLYKPGMLSTPVDPDEFPTGPRFTVHDPSGTPLTEYFSDLPYTRRIERGVYEFVLPLPSDASLLSATTTGQSYKIRLAAGTASKDGVALIGRDGAAPSLDFTLPALATGLGKKQIERFYATREELFDLFNLNPAPTDKEIRFAQLQIDNFLHRNLYPSIRVRERHDIPPDSNLLLLDVLPVIRIVAAQTATPMTPLASEGGLQGRYGLGRRDRRRTHNAWLEFSAFEVFGAHAFQPIDVEAIQIHPETGEVYLPPVPLLAQYTQCDVTYEAGFPVIPYMMKGYLAETIDYIRFLGYANLSNYSIGKVSRTVMSAITGQQAPGFLPEGVVRGLSKYRVHSLR